eukprot:CAMPEP_0179171856 /NCGR_PEP_ID=MMETSP0796-20121207/84734_1 /TAXON_ID=73915 /ORGANISM="Pyrodinium bahamense, Strain pbaha01" /LENGTH=438 /DNA_ID=CAMNT_0020874957 /DNA_START=36 /DNA_END=1352 /DNA_ORIENTATION=-
MTGPACSRFSGKPKMAPAGPLKPPPTDTSGAATPATAEAEGNVAPAKKGGKPAIWRTILGRAGLVAQKLLVPDHTGVLFFDAGYGPSVEEATPQPPGGWDEKQMRQAIEESLKDVGKGEDLEQRQIEKALELSLAGGACCGLRTEMDDFEVALALGRGAGTPSEGKVPPAEFSDEDELDVFHPQHPAQRSSSDGVSTSSGSNGGGGSSGSSSGSPGNRGHKSPRSLARSCLSEASRRAAEERQRQAGAAKRDEPASSAKAAALHLVEDIQDILQNLEEPQCRPTRGAVHRPSRAWRRGQKASSRAWRSATPQAAQDAAVVSAAVLPRTAPAGQNPCRVDRDVRSEIKRLKDTLLTSAQTAFGTEVWEMCGIEAEHVKRPQFTHLSGLLTIRKKDERPDRFGATVGSAADSPRSTKKWRGATKSRSLMRVASLKQREPA